MSLLKKVKKANGQIIACNEIFEKKPTTVKNFGIWIRAQVTTQWAVYLPRASPTHTIGGDVLNVCWRSEHAGRLSAFEARERVRRSLVQVGR
jgi:hypothetical protein